MVSKLRRLAADHAALHEELPPNYLFSPDDTQSSASDDITQLMILLAGPQGTPYSQGLWRLHLKLPEDYPKSPPKATFKTRIWHPNVEESSGSVCVDTLKRDWKSNLTLKDVLITISCLLIYPNPDSALNSTAGALLQENYDAFARQAKLMTSIHAPIPSDLRNQAMEAKMRGEVSGTTVPEQEDTSRSLRSRKGTGAQSVTMKKRPTGAQSHDSENTRPSHEPLDLEHRHRHQHQHQHSEYPQPPLPSDDENENENPTCASKENDPSLSPSPVKLVPPLSPRKNAHGKRPLSVLTTSMDMDPLVSSAEPDEMMNTSDTMTASERNIAANSNSNSTSRSTPIQDVHAHAHARERDSSPQRKSPKLSVVNRGLTSRHQCREESSGSGPETELKIFEDAPSRPTSGSGEDDNRNLDFDSAFVRQKQRQKQKQPLVTLPLSRSQPTSSSSNTLPKQGPGFTAGTRKASSSSGSKKAKPRIGIRRL
ncbi:putative ubiquitin conjugating enzyme E2 [Aspergillus undulatus]|uniref:putative ubiquitin conjugating enzyme E2 n=1 Tax=Aspergillus undulatus TaxID=1810928 RepID=UPI003CCCD163